MIIAVIYFIHAIFAVYAFSRSYQGDGWLQAFLIWDLLLQYLQFPHGMRTVCLDSSYWIPDIK
ncbi:MAG: hypothetical protein IPP52_19020 [Ignavibacteria bacterium]|nr:hypothetical protein [Ignavibacteria bacterium]